MNGEKPILFSAPMVRAILNTKPGVWPAEPIDPSKPWKWQTRRICRATNVPGLGLVPPANFAEDPELALRVCPYGPPGTRLRMLCTWSVPAKFDAVKPLDLPRDVRLWSLFGDTPKPEGFGKLRPGRFMPGWMRPQMPAAMNHGVRVARVQDISVSDCAAEGIDLDGEDAGAFAAAEKAHSAGLSCGCADPEIYPFRLLWNTINLKRGYGWDKNPWVWAIDFGRLP